jgi:hypothetical protein
MIKFDKVCIQKIFNLYIKKERNWMHSTRLKHLEIQ